MITLHHLENSQSFRILWLLEELGLNYELKIYKRQPDKLAPPEFKAISPLGTSPCITDNDDGDQDALSESNAIIDYILDKASAANNSNSKIAKQLRPTSSSTTSRRDYLFWFHVSPGSFMPLLTMSAIFKYIESVLPCLLSGLFRTVFSKVKESFVLPRLKNMMDLAETKLTAHDFLAGSELTAADITMIYGMETIRDEFADSIWKDYPKCSAWMKRMQARPAFISAQKKSGDSPDVV